MSKPGGLLVCAKKCGRTPNDRLGVGASVNTTAKVGPLPADTKIAEAVKKYLLKYGNN